MEFDFDDLKKLRESKKFLYVRTVLYAAVTYVVYVLLLALMNFTIAASHDSLGAFFSSTGYIGAYAWVYFLEVLLAILFTNSAFLVFATYDRPTREEFLKHNSIVSFKLKGAWKGALKDRFFWVRMATVWGLYLLFPAKGFVQISYLITTLLRISAFPALVTRLIGIAAFFAVSLGFSLFIYGDVRRMWLEMPRRVSKVQLFNSTEKKLKRKYSLGAMVWRLIYTTAITYIGVLALPAILGAVGVFGAVLLMLAQLKWTWIILGVAIGITYYFCIRSRFRFLWRLRRCCKKNGFKVIAKKHPYLSLIHDGGKYNIVLQANGKTYYCKILASVKKTNKIYLLPDGTCERARLLHIPAPRVIRKGGFIQANTMDMNEGREAFRIVSTFDYRFEADGEKVLLFNPVPKFLYKKVEDGTSRPLDNGETVGEYTIYAANAFLRALERNCA